MGTPINNLNSSQGAAGWLGRHESISLILLLLGFLAINLVTYARSPAVWSDEVMYADPAVNLYQGHGFTSGSWFVQPMNRFWAGNVPLYQFVLFGWLKVFGFSLLTVRSLHYLLVSVAAAFAWLGIRRLQIIGSPAYRLAFCVLLLCSSSVAFIYRHARPDTLCLLLFAACLLAFSIRSGALRMTLLFILGMFFPWSGLQMAAYAASLSGVLWLWSRNRFLKEIIFIGLGCACGGVLLYLFYSRHGVWTDFIASIRQHTIATKNMETQVRTYGTLSDKLSSLAYIYSDPSTFFLLIVGIVLLGLLYRDAGFRWNGMLTFGLAVALVVPLALFIIGMFPVYYYWMSFLPLCIAVLSALSRQDAPTLTNPARLILFGALAAACLIGLPRRLIAAALDWQGRDYSPVMSMVAPHVGGEKLVFTPYAGYYAAKQKSAMVITPPYLTVLTPEEKGRVSVAIVSSVIPNQAAWLSEKFGGDWRDTGDQVKPAVAGKFPGLHEQLGSESYRLKVFERNADPREAGSSTAP